jgi:hypothetical protein
MTIEKVKHDLISALVAYVVALLALLLWPNRQAADQNLVYLTGLAILIVVGTSVDWVAFKWRPSRPNFDLLAFVTQTRPRAPKPRGRNWIPGVLGMVAALTVASFLRTAAAPDWGITAFAIGIPLLFGGSAASNSLWALAARPGSSATPRL